MFSTLGSLRVVAFFNIGMASRNAGTYKYYPTDVLVTGFDIIFFGWLG